jgi:hypothetical protein
MGYGFGVDMTPYEIGTLSKVAATAATLSGDFANAKKALKKYADTAVIDYALTLSVSPKFYSGDDFCMTVDKAVSKICGSIHEAKVLAFGAELKTMKLVDKLKTMMSPAAANYLK